MSKEKQIDEMAKEMCECCREAVTNNTCEDSLCIGVLKHAEALYDAGYRKQSEGKWKQAYNNYPRYVCTNCNHLYNNKEYKYCPSCGAKMKGGE